MRHVSLIVVLVFSMFAGMPALHVAAQDAATPGTDAGATADWPLYRGDVGRSGAVSGTGPQGDPVLLWQFQVPGPASRSPAIAGGVAYVGGGDGILHALDAMTGEEIWQYEAGDAAEITPTVAEGMVYLNTLGGALIAVDAVTGEEAWRFAEPVAVDSTPAVVDGVLYVGSDEGFLYAADAATGEEHWRYDAGSGLPRSPAVADRVIYLGTENGQFHAVNADGSERWIWVADEELLVGTSTVADGVVYFPATGMRALDADTGEERWVFDQEDCCRPFTAGGGALFGASGGGEVFALNAATADVLWTFATGDNIQASPALVDGVLYVASYDRNVYAVDAESGEELWRFPIDGELTYGPSVANGVVYAGTSLGTVYAIGGTESSGAAAGTPVAATPAAATASMELLWQSTGGPEPMYAAGSIAIDPQGNVWVMDAANGRFQIFSPDGAFLETWDGTGGGGERFGFAKPNGGFDGDIAFDAAGNLYVSEPGSRRVQIFDAERTLLMSWDEFGPGDGQFLDPHGLAVDRAGNVYVLDVARNDVQKFDGSGNFLTSFGSSGEGQLRDVAYMAIDGDGNLWVAADDRIVVFTSDGEFVREFGSTGNAPGEFNGTADVSVATDGTVYVTDLDNGRIQAFDSNGEFLAVWDAGQTPAGSDNLPYALAVDDAGHLYVAGFASDYNSESNVQKFRLPETTG